MNSTTKARQDRGQAMLMAILFITAASAIILSGIASPVVRDVRAIGDMAASRQSFALAEGSVEDVAYRLMNNVEVSDTEALVEGTVVATTTQELVSGHRELTGTGNERNAVRTAFLRLREGIGVAFFYGLQTDTGGIHMKNNSKVIGNVFSNGPVTGENANIVRGSAISAGPTGILDGIHATGTAKAHTIQDATIDGDAYFVEISGTTVGGTQYPDSPDQATSSLPITDDIIEEWKASAEAGGTYSGECPYTITSNVTIGPLKVPCDLEVSGSPDITIAGAVWVVGDITMQNTADIFVDSSFDEKSVPIIADDPADPDGKGIIILKNSVVFHGAGDESHVLLVSQNTSAENGGAITAIEVNNSVSGDVLVYAGHGLIVLKNSVNLREVAAHRLRIENFAEVVYETGLANLLFDSGPSGGWEIDRWKEI